MKSSFLSLSVPIYLFFLLSCDSNYVDHQSLIQAIDEMEFSKIRYKIEIDEDGRILDTAVTFLYKYDHLDQLCYEQKHWKIVFEDKVDQLVTIAYYNNSTDPFFQQTRNKVTNYCNRYQGFFNKQGQLQESRVITNDQDGISDTINMSFEYFYDSSHRLETQMMYSYVDSSESFMRWEFNGYEKVENEYFVLGEDTIESRRFIYVRDTIPDQAICVRQAFENYQKEVYYYNHQWGKTDSIKEWSANELISGTLYEYDDQGNLIKETEREYRTNCETYWKYIELTASSADWNKEEARWSQALITKR